MDVFGFILVLVELTPKIRSGESVDCESEQIKLKNHQARILHSILMQAEMGFDWRNTRASEIYRNGLCLDEVAEYVEVNWSTIRAARERRRLMRKMAMSELMHDQPSDEELQRMRNLNLSSSEVSQYAQRFASSALGRARIVEEIIEAAV